jgi:SAM-dependent methyltransferase
VTVDREIVAHYDLGLEARRLSAGAGRLEAMRTCSLLERVLPPPPSHVLDVGGGPGFYARWLLQRGHSVRLLDPMALHVAAARAGEPPVDAEEGDARDLPDGDATADAVLLLGPLYHLVDRDGRAAAWREAARVVRPGGVVVAAGISRFASALDGVRQRKLRDPDFGRIVTGDLLTGVHRNPGARPEWFTTAYFHHPDELADEAEDAGLAVEAVVGVEGPFWLLPDLDARLDDDTARHELMAALLLLEAERSLAGASAHLLLVGRRVR